MDRSLVPAYYLGGLGLQARTKDQNARTMTDHKTISRKAPGVASPPGEILPRARPASRMAQPAGWTVPTYQSLVARFSDPEAFVAAGGAGQARFVAAPGRSFRADLSSVLLDQISVTSAHATAPSSLTAMVPRLHAFVFATDAAPSRRLSGHEVRPDQIFAFRPNGDATSVPTTADPWP
jgi:hypothetical protein